MRNKLFLAIAILLVLGLGAVAGAGIFYLALNPSTAYAQTGTQVPTGRDAGILVGAVTADSPAAKAGIVRGDIIQEANGKVVNQPVELNDIVKGLKVGDKLTLTVLHGDATSSVDVTLADQNGQVYLGLHPAVVISGFGESLFGRGFGVFGRAANFSGALVTGVTSGGPADKAGIQAGDLILSVNGQAVNSTNDLSPLILAQKPGDTLTLSVQKKGATSATDVKVTLGDDPNKAGQAYLGISYRLGPVSTQPNGTLPPQAGRGYRNFGQPPFNNAPQSGQTGVIVSAVTIGSPAEKAGVKAKDLITAVNGKAVTTPDELSSLVKAGKSGDKLTLTITRAGEQNPLSIDATLAANPDNSGTTYLGVTLVAVRQPFRQAPVTPTPTTPGTNS